MVKCKLFINLVYTNFTSNLHQFPFFPTMTGASIQCMNHGATVHGDVFDAPKGVAPCATAAIVRLGGPMIAVHSYLRRVSCICMDI